MKTTNKILIIIIAITFFSCSNEKGRLSDQQISLMQKCIEYIEVNEAEDYKKCYLVDPYFTSFLIENHFESRDESFIKLFAENDHNYYKDLQKSLDREFSNKYSKDLSQLISCDRESNYVLRFSGMNDKILIGYVYVYFNQLTKENLIQRNYNDTLQEMRMYVFVLDGKGKIKEVIKDGVIFN